MLSQDIWRLLGILVVAFGTVSAYNLIHDPNEGQRHEESPVPATSWPVSPGSPALLTYCQHDVYGYVDAVVPWQGCIGGWQPISQKQYQTAVAEEATDSNEIAEQLGLENAAKFASTLDNEGYSIEILNHDEEDGSVLFGITSRGKKAMAHVFKNGVLLFRSYWVDQGYIKLQKINEWNYNHKFSRMYIDKDNDIVLQTDVMIPGNEFQSEDISFHTNMFFELKRLARDWILKSSNTNENDVPENTNFEKTIDLKT